MTEMLSVLYLLAMGQGLFLAVALLSGRQPATRMANRLLAVLLLVSVAVIGHAWLGLHGLYRSYPHSAGAIWTLGLLPGPLLYLYMGSLLFGRPVAGRTLLHFLPFALATLALLPFYLQPAAAKLAWMTARSAPHWLVVLAAPAKLAIFLAYVAACIGMVRAVPDSPLVRGLRGLMLIWLAGGALSVAALVVELFEFALPLPSDAIGALALLCFVYATALLAMRVPLGYKPLQEPEKPRYGGKRLSEPDRSRFLAALTASMEQEYAYRDGELTLNSLAARLAMTGHELSQLINDACGVNFQDYLNRYRVEEIKSALQGGEQAEDGVLEMALAAGFNSKSAFNRAFKKHTGVTPSEFRRTKHG